MAEHRGQEHPDEGEVVYPFARKAVAIVERYPWWVLAVGLAVGVFAVWRATHLKIDQNLRRLLPSDATSLIRLDEMDEVLGNQSNLIVAIYSPDRASNIRFGEALERELSKRDDMRWVLFHRDFSFFEDNALLFADLADVLDLRDEVIERIRDAVKDDLIVELDEGEGDSEGKDALDEAELRERYGLEEEKSGYWEADEGRIMVLKARPDVPNTDFSYAKRLLKETNALIDSMEPSSFHPELRVVVEGSYSDHSKRAKAMEGAVAEGSLTAFGILLFSIAIFFRSIRSVPLVLTPLLISVFAALAFAQLNYGFLNIVSAFILAVLLGLGIDFGTHILARYRDERARGLARREALEVTLSTTGLSTGAGALTTFASFALLSVANFQGFAQFGVVAAVGIALAFLSAVLLMPAFTVILSGKGTGKPIVTGRPPDAAARPPRADVSKTPWLALLMLALGGGAAVFAVVHLDDLEFEYDMNKLGPVKERRASDGSLNWKDASGRSGSKAPAIALTTSLEQSRSVQRQFDALLELEEGDIPALLAGQPLPSYERKRQERKQNEAESSKATEALPTGEVAGAVDPLDEDDPFGDPAVKSDGVDALAEDDPFGDPLEEDDPFGDPTAKKTDAGADDYAVGLTPESRFEELSELAERVGSLAPETIEMLKRYPEARLEEMRDRLREIFSIYDFVPDLQAEKLEVIVDIKARIDRKREALSQSDQDKLDEWYHYLEVTSAVSIDDLPSWVRAQTTDRKGQIGTFVMFWTKGPKADYENAKRIYDAYFDIETPQGKAPTVADFYVLPEIVDTLAADGPVVITLALIMLLFTAWLLFRNLAGPVVVFLTVGLALLWVVAVMEIAGWKANLFNLVAIPLLVGIGQDDALHLFHRYREEGPGRLGVVLRETGAAIFLTTWTTCIGFAGIFFANHRGLLTLAQVSVAGVALCFVSSVLMLPSALRVIEWVGARRAGAGGSEEV